MWWPKTLPGCWLLAASTAVAAHGCEQRTLHDTPNHSHRNPSLRSWHQHLGDNATGNLIFQSLASLMQMTPNARYPNGHSIVRASIPPGTLLYHGNGNGHLPSMDWLAFDPEHSQMFARGVHGTLFTLSTTRELNLVYFDGCSANKIGGVTDAQDILIWGEVGHGREPWHWDPELDRIADACAWGKEYGIDGFVRMEYDFEIMHCDFSRGLQVVSSMATVGGHGALLKGWKGTLPSSLMEVRHAGSWHNAFPGETRVHLHPSTLLSFFDPALTSLVEARRALRRGEYRLSNISKEDIRQVRADVTEAMTRDPHREASGVDWIALARTVQDRFASRLTYIRHLLHLSPRNTSTAAVSVRSQLFASLSPYMPLHRPVGDLTWFAEIAEACRTRVTSHLPVWRFTKQERVLLRATEEVLHELCRVYTEAWADAFDVEAQEEDVVVVLLAKWRVEFDALIKWLDWPVWMACDPTCDPNEFCEVPQRVPWRIGNEPRPRCVPIDSEWI